MQKSKAMDAMEVVKYFLILNAKLNDSIREQDDDESFTISPDPITHLKMQKLLYYAQCICLYYLEHPLFEAEIEAWKHGPVVREVYEKLKDYKDKDLMQCLKPKEKELHLSEEAKTIIRLAFGKYAKYTASQLRNKTHKESPWKDNFEKGKSNPISLETMQSFYKQERQKELRHLLES